ncbi:40S ribosomal protein S11 [Microtus ochrogaster]|uniref:40S ribosomal protein S11 n=1 Tax=Microtus ochrogaster TaxID=79684 RepID=A0A8J6L2G5_MICOH|nr:40S ribosomal protein S11 [Microtus ochrogaster]
MSWNGDAENMLMKVSMQTLRRSSGSEEAYRRRPETGEENSLSAPLQLSPLGSELTERTGREGEAARHAERSCGCGQFPFYLHWEKFLAVSLKAATRQAVREETWELAHLFSSPVRKMMGIQTEHAYQKQSSIFQTKKCVLLGEAPSVLQKHWSRLYKTPKEAMEDSYIEKNCPLNGNVSIQGRTPSGAVTQTKIQMPTVISWEYLTSTSTMALGSATRACLYTCSHFRDEDTDAHCHQLGLSYIHKYNGFEKYHKSMSVHLFPFQGCADGNTVTMGACRPLRFDVLKATKEQFHKF